MHRIRTAKAARGSESRMALLALAVLLTACSDPTGAGRGVRLELAGDFAAVEAFPECRENEPVRDVPADVRESIIESIGEDWHDGEWAAIARRVPGGFGGLWLSRAGYRVVGLVDTTQRVAALQALAAEPALEGRINAGTAVVEVRWTFAQLVEWSYYLRPTIWSEPEIASLDRGERENRIVVGVASEAARDRLLAALRARGDVPCALVRIEPGYVSVPY